MSRNTERVSGFPSARLPSYCGGLPVEVVLVAQLGHGAGDRLIADAGDRQRGHLGFIDELDEPSVRIGAPDIEKGDATALYSFAVGAHGHPFHRHAGHRVFTAITGSGGALLRFSTASDAQLAADPRHFLHALRQVRLPADCLFTVRFGDGAWHQFAPLRTSSRHPVFFALSCHTNELGGPLTDSERQQVAAGTANLASLTELLPEVVARVAASRSADDAMTPTISLSLEAPADSAIAALCAHARAASGRLRAWIGLCRHAGGFISARRIPVQAMPATPADSLLAGELPAHHHDDSFVLTQAVPTRRNAEDWLAQVLDGFLQQRPAGVTWLMRLRNVLVRPLRLRTSPLGCPVSSLLSDQRDSLFLGRYPVLVQKIDADGRRAQVILGADDRHLRFRSCVGVQLLDNGRIEISLGTRVQCTNLFGRCYMATIAAAHRRYISPSMLRHAAEFALGEPATATAKPSDGIQPALR
ncbi:DUF2867 domain-containing protein [Pseudoxanthomonas indica]|uniref:DUF2867 domain-containing protein n=1 Tax=Pseudoxanthomonas indica TaxID=428993 RepID=A0A1T5LPB2_9GAMM|nr:DUF2867 domain-containing protein [Pseudoxanthomonas indica]GGD37659.1 hypothetical protein GCM10007235_07340 [Pseudoxanthomonas indica]SKC77796.1 Protein of unknown function [Pseudoxanthomonas indica]